MIWGYAGSKRLRTPALDQRLQRVLFIWIKTERQRDRETERQRDRETERQRQRDRETERQRDKETESFLKKRFC